MIIHGCTPKNNSFTHPQILRKTPLDCSESLSEKEKTNSFPGPPAGIRVASRPSGSLRSQRWRVKKKQENNKGLVTFTLKVDPCARVCSVIWLISGTREPDRQFTWSQKKCGCSPSYPSKSPKDQSLLTLMLTVL